MNAITTLVGEEEEGEDKWIGTLAAPNGSLYGIPYYAGRVAKFNPLDKSMTHIGPDFGYYLYKWYRGAITDNGVIYCPPGDPGGNNRGILKIDTNTDDVTELNVNLLPEQGSYFIWKSCALALDGCIYFMPSSGRRIMKLDPNNNDAMSSVGDDLGDKSEKYIGTIVGIDGYVYGIPFYSKRILKYDPINDIISYVGEEANEDFCCTAGALGRDGCIYAYTYVIRRKSWLRLRHRDRYRNRYDGKVLKIDTINNSHCFVGNIVESSDLNYGDGSHWGVAILGIDGCIYWPPCNDYRLLKYDPHTDQITLQLLGDFERRGYLKWKSGALSTDGVIYCLPSTANRVLAIDPIREFLATTKTNMQEHPEEFGSLFQTIEQAEEDSAPHVSLTNFDHAVVKFGHCEVFEILENTMKPVNDYCKESNLSPFMLAASYTESSVCVINHLLRRDLSWVNSCIGSFKQGTEPKHTKRTILYRWISRWQGEPSK